jgi:hypothetical protein
MVEDFRCAAPAPKSGETNLLWHHVEASTWRCWSRRILQQTNNKNSVYDALNQRAEVWQIGQSNETRILVDSYCATKGDQCSEAGRTPKPKLQHF